MAGGLERKCEGGGKGKDFSSQTGISEELALAA